MPPGKLDEINARHAEEFANVTQLESLDLPRRNGPTAAQTYRGLTDHQLAVTATLTAGSPAISVAEMIERLAIGEIEGHVNTSDERSMPELVRAIFRDDYGVTAFPVAIHGAMTSIVQ